MSKIIYFASPYSHSDPEIVEHRIKANSIKVAQLVAEGNVVISPIIYGHQLLKFHSMPSDWDFWKNFCQSFLHKCEELIVFKIDGWDKSTGVLSEIKLAEELGLKITYVEA